jgi:hypothetical protein
MKRAWVLSWVLAGCTSAKPPPPVPEAPTNPPEAPKNGPEVIMNKAPTPSLSARCTTDAEIRAKLGEVCSVIGTYELKEITNKKGGAWRTWPIVKLDGDKFIALESVWDETKMPPPDEVARWRGKKVEVTGTVLGQPPSKSPANMAMLTMAPVESIKLAE